MHKLSIAFAAATALLSSAPVAAKLTAASSSSSITCKDGSMSPSKTRQGACGGHGGIADSTTTASKTMTTPAGNTSSMTTGKGMSKTKTTTMASAPMTSDTMAPSSAAIMCKDGTASPSKTRQGACRGHMGIADGMPASTKTMATPAGDTTSMTTSTGSARSTTTTTAGAAPMAAGVTAICNDGTTSMSKTHSGTCSSHKGVKTWVK